MRLSPKVRAATQKAMAPKLKGEKCRQPNGGERKQLLY